MHNNNYHNYPFQQFDFIAAIGTKHALIGTSTKDAFEQIENFKALHSNQYCFGYFGYDLKNDTEVLGSALPDHVGFHEFYFFIPEHILICKNGELEIISNESELIYQTISQQESVTYSTYTQIKFQHRTSKEKYLADVNDLQQHIRNGTIYEINYCQEFFAEQVEINPLQVFKKLNEKK